MMRCITVNNPKASLKSNNISAAEKKDGHAFFKDGSRLYKLLAAMIVLGLWWGLSKIYSPLVVPPISTVALKLAEIASSPRLWTEIGRTVSRLLYGLMLGIGIGCLEGLIAGVIKPIKLLLQPILGIIQVVPPISWLILAIIWFGLNGSASVFIVIMAVVPTMFICISDGIIGIDRRLLEMGEAFRFSRAKKLRYIMIPSVMPHFCSGLKIAAGTACKTVVMGEVLTTTTGIGGQIMTARLNIEPETVIAWTVIVVCIYYIAMLFGRIAVCAVSTAAERKRIIHRGLSCLNHMNTEETGMEPGGKEIA